MSLTISNVRLLMDRGNYPKRCTVRCDAGRITSIQEYEEEGSFIESDTVIDGRGGLLLPSLCHSHIHLDKCYILDKGDPLISGDFSEALEVTAKVKSTFKETKDDLHRRGDKLIRESLQAGVTCVRAHVEVDTTVADSCLEVGLQLKSKWKQQCDIHIAQFMQDPLFESVEDDTMGPNASIFTDVLRQHAHSISAVGSAPYVERTRTQQMANIRFILDLAIQHNLHADFHLDYDLKPLFNTSNTNTTGNNETQPDENDEPLTYYLIEYLHSINWTKRMKGKTILIGHATRLSRLTTRSQLSSLRARIGDLPVHFVGLPQSDLYMMGRDVREVSSGLMPRGTINVCQWRKGGVEDEGSDHSVSNTIGAEAGLGLNVALSVNNVGNAFTPQGTPDPLSLCTLGVAIYQDATLDGCLNLLRSVSVDSKRAIGALKDDDTYSYTRTTFTPNALSLSTGASADFVLLHDNQRIESAVLEPSFDRTTIKAGRVVARRVVTYWVADSEDD